MNNRFKAMLVVPMIGMFAIAIAAHHEKEVVLPAKISKADAEGTIFQHDDMAKTKHDDGNVTLDVTSLLSSDKKFASGMYKSGKTRSEIDEPYGVDEFIDLPARTVWWTEDGGQSRSEKIPPATTPQGKLAARVSEAEL